jgi:N utilization substance protein B
MSKKKSSSSRRRAREVALQVLYAIDLASSPRRVTDIEDELVAGEEISAEAKALAATEAFEAVATSFEMPAGAREFAQDLVESVLDHRQEVDEAITSHAKNWRISRMATVDRNILRLGVFELLYSDLPKAIVISQAVELAKKFSTAKSGAFVNGVLSAVAASDAEPASDDDATTVDNLD